MEESDEDLVRKIALLQKRLERRKQKRKFEKEIYQDAIQSGSSQEDKPLDISSTSPLATTRSKTGATSKSNSSSKDNSNIPRDDGDSKRDVFDCEYLDSNNSCDDSQPDISGEDSYSKHVTLDKTSRHKNAKDFSKNLKLHSTEHDSYVKSAILYKASPQKKSSENNVHNASHHYSSRDASNASSDAESEESLILPTQSPATSTGKGSRSFRGKKRHRKTRNSDKIRAAKFPKFELLSDFPNKEPHSNEHNTKVQYSEPMFDTPIKGKHFIGHFQTIGEQLTQPEPFLAPKLADSPETDVLKNLAHLSDHLGRCEETPSNKFRPPTSSKSVPSQDVSDSSLLIDKVKSEKAETDSRRLENFTDRENFQSEPVGPEKVRSFRMPSPNYTLILQEESYFTLPKEYTCLKLEYSRMQAILTDRPAKKRKQNGLTQSSSLHDSDLLYGALSSASTLSSANLVCDIVPSSQSPSQLNVGLKRQLKRGKKRHHWSSVKNPKRSNKNSDASKNLNIDNRTSLSSQISDTNPKLSGQRDSDNSKSSPHPSVQKYLDSDVISPTLCHQKQSFVEDIPSPFLQCKSISGPQSPSTEESSSTCLANDVTSQILESKPDFKNTQSFSLCDQNPSLPLCDPSEPKQGPNSSRCKDSADTISTSVLLNALSFPSSGTAASSKHPVRQNFVEPDDFQESPAKKGEIFFSSQSPVISRSLRRKLRRKRSSIDKKLSDNFVKNVDNVVKANIIKAPVHLEKAPSDISIKLNKNVDGENNDNIENKDQAGSVSSQSLLRPISASARATMSSPKLPEQKDGSVEVKVEEVPKTDTLDEFTNIDLKWFDDDLAFSDVTTTADRKLDGLDQNSTGNDVKVSCLSKVDSTSTNVPRKCDVEFSLLTSSQGKEETASIEPPKVEQHFCANDEPKNDQNNDLAENDNKLNPYKSSEKVSEVNETALFPTTDSLDLCNFNTMDLLSDEQEKNRILDLSPHLKGRSKVQRVFLSEHQNRIVLCLVTQFSIEFFGMSRFGCLPGQSFEIISRFDRKMGDRGESDQILFCLESPEIKNVLFVCLKSFVCQSRGGGKSGWNLQEFSYGFQLDLDSLISSQTYNRRILILSEPRLMKSVSCTKLLLGQSLILSYFLPALDVSRVHLLHHNQHLGPQLQAQHLVSVRGRISQLMTVNQSASLELIFICDDSNENCLHFAMDLKEDNFARLSKLERIKMPDCQIASSIVSVQRLQNGDLAVDRLISDSSVLQRSVVVSNKKDRQIDDILWQKDFGQSIKSVDVLTSFPSMLLTFSMNDASVWDFSSNDTRENSFVWKIIFSKP